MNASKTVDARKTIEQNTSATIEQNASKTIKVGTAKDFLTCINYLLEESRHMTTLIGKIITMNQMTGTEQPDRILLPTNEIRGSVSISHPFRTYTDNRPDPTIQPTIVHFKQVNGLGNSDQKHFPIGILNSSIDIPWSWSEY